jgi:hypothetical protein
MNGWTAWLNSRAPGALDELLEMLVRDCKIFTCSITRVLYYLMICSCFIETSDMHDDCDLHDQNAIDS